jgi:hypothetical protein
VAWCAYRLRSLLGLIGTLWLTLFLTVVSVPRCSLFASFSDDHVETKTSHHCHEEEAPSRQGAEVSAPADCRCMLFKGLVFRVAEPEVGAALSFQARSQRELEFILVQSYEEVVLDQDVPYPKFSTLS